MVLGTNLKVTMRPFFLRWPSPSTVSMNLHSACYIQALSKCFIFNLHLIITHEQLGDNFLLRKRDRLLFVDKNLVSSTSASQSSSLIQQLQEGMPGMIQSLYFLFQCHWSCCFLFLSSLNNKLCHPLLMGSVFISGLPCPTFLRT